MADLRIYDDRASAARALAALVVTAAQSAVAARDRFTLVLCGGSTPRQAFRLLADEYADDIDWSRTSIFWSDERCVPADHPDSNTKMAREALLDHVPLAFDRIYRIPTQLDPASAAQAYQAELVRFFESRGGIPRFDMMILGVGADGHTASLFPGSPALDEKKRWVVTATAENAPVKERITFTLPILNAAAHVVMLVLGEEKADAVARIFTGDDDPPLPAGRVQPLNGRLTWILDEEAASRLRAATIDDQADEST